MWGMKICSHVPGHMTMPIYGKNFKRQSQICFLKCFCMGESLYSTECSCISKFVLIQLILSTQVSNTGPLVLWCNFLRLALQVRMNLSVFFVFLFVFTKSLHYDSSKQRYTI